MYSLDLEEVGYEQAINILYIYISMMYAIHGMQNTCTYPCMQACMDVCVYACMHVYMYVCVCVFIRACM
jgi:hypothetical protein